MKIVSSSTEKWVKDMHGSFTKGHVLLLSTSSACDSKHNSNLQGYFIVLFCCLKWDFTLAQADLKLMMILLPQPSRCYRWATSPSTDTVFKRTEVLPVLETYREMSTRLPLSCMRGWDQSCPSISRPDAGPSVAGKWVGWEEDVAFPDQRCRLEGHAAAEVPPSSTNMCKYRNGANVTKKITSCCFPFSDIFCLAEFA